MPEAVNLRARLLPEDHRDHALFGNHFKTPRPSHDGKQRPDQARYNRQDEALAPCKSGAGFVGHCPDSIRASARHTQSSCISATAPAPAESLAFHTSGFPRDKAALRTTARRKYSPPAVQLKPQ